MSENEPDTTQLKDVEFYAANVNAWFNTRFEHDKSLLSLSAGAVGLLITLISTVGVKSVESLILYIFALACFVTCLGSLLWIFRRNAKHLEDVVTGKSMNDELLNTLDRIAVSTFMVGVVFSSIIGITTAIQSYTEKANKMSEDKKTANLVISQESFAGISAMKPQSKEQASVNNVSNMRPAQTPSVPQSQPSTKEGK